MATLVESSPTVRAATETRARETLAEEQYERWVHWPINWSAIWVGALASITAVLIFGLIGIAIGAHLIGPEHRVVDLKKIGIGTLAFSVFSAFLAFVIGGWVAGKIAGILHSEPAMLYGAIVWLLAVPILVVLAGIGASNSLGAWYSGLSGTPSWATPAETVYDRPEQPGVNATDRERADFKAEQQAYLSKVKQWREDSPKVARNSALGAVTALLLGLIGSVLGGWMACGEPMSLTHSRNRPLTTSNSFTSR